MRAGCFAQFCVDSYQISMRGCFWTSPTRPHKLQLHCYNRCRQPHNHTVTCSPLSHTRAHNVLIACSLHAYPCPPLLTSGTHDYSHPRLFRSGPPALASTRQRRSHGQPSRAGPSPYSSDMQPDTFGAGFAPSFHVQRGMPNGHQ